LYALLTIEAPFQGRHVGEVIDLARRSEFPPPRQWKKDLPRPLEAICLKAMARQPADRYATALDLAADLEHWLADEPVSAWPEPWTVRTRRWLGRHRTLVTAVAAAAVVALVSLSVATLLLAAANDREQKARHQAETQEARAKENFDLARQAVDEMLTEVGYQHLKDVPQAEAVRRALLTRAHAFYQKFLREGGDDPAVRQETARTYRKLGDIHLKLDKYPEAEEAFRRAGDLQTSLTEAFPGEPGYHHDLAETRQRLGFLYRNRGQVQRARDVYQEALVSRERLVAEHPRPEYRDELAYLLIDLGVVYSQTGEVGRAREAYERARDLAVALEEEDPVTAKYQERGARARNNLGILHAVAGRAAQAEEMFRANLRTWEKLRRAHPENKDYRDEEAKGWNNLGSLFLETQRPADALAHKERARDLVQDLARDYPLIPEYRSYLASSLTDLGQMHQLTRHWDKAERSLEEARVLMEKLTHDYPFIRRYSSKLVATYLALSQLYRGSDQVARAQAPGEKAVELAERLAKDFPGITECQEQVAASYLEMGQFYHLSDQPVRALPLLDKALVLFARLAGTTGRPSHADQAMAALRLAVEKGYEDRARLQKDPDLDPLREREDFKRLLAELAGRSR
jgi:serine/threonine-protein kinase